MENSIEWEGFKIDLTVPIEKFVLFVDIYNDLNIMNKQTFNLIKIAKYSQNGEEAFLMKDTKGSIISRFMDFNFIINQLL